MKIKLDIYSHYSPQGFIAEKMGELNPFFHPGSQFRIAKMSLPTEALVKTKNVRPRRFCVSQMPDCTVLTEL